MALKLEMLCELGILYQKDITDQGCGTSGVRNDATLALGRE